MDGDGPSRAALAHELAFHGARVVEASSCSAAIGLLSSAGPDVVVSEIDLPDVDGWALVEALRATLPPLCEIPAVALTSRSTHADETRSLRAGFVLHVSKPANPAWVARLLAALVRPDPGHR